jgi:hypothetical protein
MVVDRQQKIKMEFLKPLLYPCDMLPEWDSTLWFMILPEAGLTHKRKDELMKTIIVKWAELRQHEVERKP